MASGSFVSYLRVSTERQGKSGLGLEAQRTAVTDFLNGGRWTLLREFVEVESGKRDDRPELIAALAHCRVHGATLVIAKIDRLSRDVHFLTGLQKAGVKFLAADMPEANEMVVQMMAVVAQAERKMISKRTKDALAAAKARGVTRKGAPLKLGGFQGYVPSSKDRADALKARQAAARARGADLAPIVAEIRAAGVTSATGLAKALTERGVPTARGAATWSTIQAQRLLASFP